MRTLTAAYRFNKLRTLALSALALLFVKVLLAIVYDYRWYFPANFGSAFLTGREALFHGSYRAAFYAHIISGPLVVILGSCLMLTGGNRRFRQFHRYGGRVQILTVILIVAPSGFVMALSAHAGPIAALGFALLSLATAATAIITIRQAQTRKFQSHQRWANRCFILLCSPLLLRLFAGALMVLQWDSEWTYRLNAWISWLIPLAIYEFGWRFPASGRAIASLAFQSRSTQRAVP